MTLLVITTYNYQYWTPLLHAYVIQFNHCHQFLNDYDFSETLYGKRVHDLNKRPKIFGRIGLIIKIQQKLKYWAMKN